jgi:hypothetical protein
MKWGTSSQFSSVTAYAVDMGRNTYGKLSVYTSFCSSKGKTVPQQDYPRSNGSAGREFSSTQSSSGLHQTAAAYWSNHVVPAFPSANYNNILIMQGNYPECWAYNAAKGSMGAFGGPSGTGDSFCMGGQHVSKRFHIYICSNNNKRLEEGTEEGEGEDDPMPLLG